MFLLSIIYITVANVYPTLDTNPNNQCVEVKEGQSIQFTCIYNASTDRNVTITTWKFNEELLEHDSSHYTIITHYGSDPVNFNRVLSRITLSNVIPDNAGTYTCQCAYNPKIFNDKDVVSEAANFCLKVKPGQEYIRFLVFYFPLDRLPTGIYYNNCSRGDNSVIDGCGGFDIILLLEKTKEQELRSEI